MIFCRMCKSEIFVLKQLPSSGYHRLHLLLDIFTSLDSIKADFIPVVGILIVVPLAETSLPLFRSNTWGSSLWGLDKLWIGAGDKTCCASIAQQPDEEY